MCRCVCVCVCVWLVSKHHNSQQKHITSSLLLAHCINNTALHHTIRSTHQEEGKGFPKYGVKEVLGSGRSQAKEVNDKEILTTGVVHQSEVGATEQGFVGVLWVGGK